MCNMRVAFSEMKFVFARLSLIFVVLCRVDTKIEYNTLPPAISRATPYSPRVLRKTCLLKPDPGPCRANIEMYHYDPEEKKCDTFFWGGCMGNGNRFDTVEECTSWCVSVPNEKLKPPRYCKLSFDYGFCFGAVNRWYYDRLWKVCKKTLYSGCGGNKNNFHTSKQCDAICSYDTRKQYKSKKNGTKKILIINPLKPTPKNRTILTIYNRTKYNGKDGV